MVGSLTGAVAFFIVTEACNGADAKFDTFLVLGLMAYTRLTAEDTNLAGINLWSVIATHQPGVVRLVFTDKRYAGDNRLIVVESSY